MKIEQKECENLITKLLVTISPDDYKEQVDKVLNDYRKNAVVPGFRKGKTPIGIINKKYRAVVLHEEINKLIQDALHDHINKNRIKILGSPMPLENKEINWERDEEFCFEYEIGLAPDFDIKITLKDKLNYYKIKADKKMVDNYCHDIAKRHGIMSNPDLSIEGDLLFCEIRQLDIDGNIMKEGVQNDATISTDYIIDKKIKKQFIGVKIGDQLTVNVSQAFSNHHDVSAMLNITKKQLEMLKLDNFYFTIKTINRLKPAELNIDLFDKVYGKGVVTNLKSFKSKIKSEAESQLISESDRMLKNDVVNYFIDKLKLKLPDDFLKRWLVKSSKKPITMEMVNTEYDMYCKSLQWQLIENKIIENYNIEVSQKDVLDHSKRLISLQMKQYGDAENMDEKKLDEIAAQILKNEKERKKIYDQIYDQRTMDVYKENFKLKETTVSYEDFIKLASENN